MLALALSYLVRLLRIEPAMLVKAFAWIALGVGVVVLAVINNEIRAAGTVLEVALAIGSPLLLIAAGNLAAAILRAELGDRWLMDALGVPRAIRGLAAIAVIAAFGAVWGAGLGLSATLAAGTALADSIGLWSVAAAWGMVLAVVALGCRRWVDSGDGREGGGRWSCCVASPSRPICWSPPWAPPPWRCSRWRR